MGVAAKKVWPAHPDTKNRISAGFTIIELLVVISIGAMLMSLAVPAVNNIIKTKGISRAINDVSAMIELARGEAMAKRTYVWLGFYNATVNGNSQLLVLATRSLDGEPTLTSGNTRLVGKVQKFDNILLTDQGGLGDNTKTILGSDVEGSTAPAVYGPLATVSSGLSIPVSGSTTTFTHFVTFTPQGQALVTSDPSTARPPTPFTNKMLIGLRKTSGTSVIATDADSAALVISGGTCSVGVFRP